MARDIVDIQDFTILVKESNAEQVSLDACYFDEPLIAVAFYGSGNVHLTVNYGDQQKSYEHTSGLALASFADEQVEFVHRVSADRPLQCIATAARNLAHLPYQAGELFGDLLQQLVQPQGHYVEGPRFLMIPEMQAIVDLVFCNTYSGKAKMMFFRSQMTALLAHFFGQLSRSPEIQIPAAEREKLLLAKEILHAQMDRPPSRNFPVKSG